MDTTTATATTGTAPASDPSLDSGPLRRPLALLGGIALATAPLLLMGGIVTSPPQDSGATADYIESLARDPFLSSVSATLFHYGWVALALGMLASMSLVRSRRGAALTLVGGLLAALTAIQVSGLLVMDWFNSSLGRHLPLAQAAAVTDDILDPALSFWLVTGRIAIVAPVLLWAGLARAGMLRWWLVPLGLFPLVIGPLVGGLVPGTAGLVLAWVVGVVAFAPAFAVARQLFRRARRAA